jgi:putative ABC transport system permease protein
MLAVLAVAGVAVLVGGRLAAQTRRVGLLSPLLAKPSSGLIGTAGKPAVTMSTIAIVSGVAVFVAVAATLVPSLRAAHTCTLSALIDAARPPRRRPRLIALSRRPPISLSVAVRLAARRPRRSLLSAVSVCVTVATLVTVMTAHTRLTSQSTGNDGLSALDNPRVDRLDQVMLVVTVVLITAVLTAIPSRIGARRPVAEILRAEHV